MGWMAQQPGHGNGRTAGLILFRNFINLFVELRKLFIVQEYPLKKPVLEWRPGLNSNIIDAAEIQYAAIPVHCLFIQHIDMDPLGNHVGICNA